MSYPPHLRRQGVLDTPLTYVEQQVVEGGTAGDGSLLLSRRDANARFRVTRKMDHLEYLVVQATLLQRLLAPKGIFCCRRAGATYSGQQQQYVFDTMQLPVFTDTRYRWYSGAPSTKHPRGEKRFTPTCLEGIEPLALAIWYMDDGSLSKASNAAFFSVGQRTPTELELLTNWFSTTWGIVVKVYPQHGGNSTLWLGRQSIEQLYSVIATLMPDCMQYKLPPKYRGAFSPSLNGLVDPIIWDVPAAVDHTLPQPTGVPN